jgi:hypothetical protein
VGSKQQVSVQDHLVGEAGGLRDRA